ncbi:MAG: prephenate dehydratase [Brevundimonas sp.]|uniref:prephenate dehydratase domain-containing protein n=1 Tax=Brevundimonas sp. TaxID=1871086 RepID=UPI0025BF464F|nr:prephenate dehydratase domain-containing protein [Brevundimonas sp.]MBX3476100.1 prephenate dehydratase [Brevundimonas sp.]
MTHADSVPQGKAPPLNPGRVAYQGAPGAFSHEACLNLRPWDAPIGFPTFQDAIQAMLSGDCGCALIPVENTIIGRVEPAASLVEALDMEPAAEVWRPIRLVLMAPPGARLSDIRTAESHPAALGQCVHTLKAMGIAPVEAFDTAGAAQAVAEAGDRTRAAIAPRGAADAYGLSILSNDLQDSADNRTRFVLLSAQTA